MVEKKQMKDKNWRDSKSEAASCCSTNVLHTFMVHYFRKNLSSSFLQTPALVRNRLRLKAHRQGVTEDCCSDDCLH